MVLIMTTRQLYYLVTISDLGNLSAAAQTLGISQPALSKFLSEYEDSIGLHLFMRYRRKLTPTAIGRVVIDSAQKILDEQTRMLQNIRAMTDTNHSQIRLATAPNRGAIIYSRIYNQFSKRYPDVSLSLTELYASEQPSAIQHGQIDIAIGSGKTSDKVTDLPFAYEELLVSLPVSHPMSVQKKIRLADLKDTPFVLQGPKHSIRILAEELFQEAGFSPVVTFESNDVILVDSMLHQAVGVGLVSQAHVFPCDELVYLPLDPPVRQTLHIRYPLGHTLTEPERYLAGLLIQERLSDQRYQANPLKESEELMQLVAADAKTPEETGTAQPLQSDYAPPPINLNTALLKYIIAIVDEKSLTRAADKYYLTQPALSRHLRRAEEMVCAQLFSRVHNQLQPTNAGKIFVNFARNILQIEAELTDYLTEYKKGHGGVWLQCDPSLTASIQEKVIPAFQSLHPDIQLNVIDGIQSESQESLLSDSADLGLYFSCQNHHPILDTRIIAQSELVYCYGSGVSLAEKVLPSRLEPHPMMVSLKGSALAEEQYRLMGTLWETSPDIVCYAKTDILRTLSQLGVADTILPLDYLSEQAIERCVSFEKKQQYYLLAAYHPGRIQLPYLRDLCDIMAGVFQDYFHNPSFK